MRRSPGTCSIEARGRNFRVRAVVDGRLVTISPPGGCDSRAEAEEIAAAFIEERNAQVLRQGLTLEQFGRGFLDRRERRGIRGIKTERYIWRRVTRADLGDLPLASIRRADIVDWLDGQDGAAQTRRNALNLLRQCFNDAVDRELIDANPARDVRLHRSADVEDEDKWTVLRPDEQIALLDAVPQAERPLVVFALVTGLRQSEQYRLKWDDVSETHVTVRRAKNRRNRRVPLLPPARAAAAAMARESEYVFPSPRGHRRQPRAPGDWHQWVAAAGIERRVRWHDLRHTCGTSLLAGWWGGAEWAIRKVQAFLGHRNLVSTERYAHLLQQDLDAQAQRVEFPANSPLLLGQEPKQLKEAAPPARVELATNSLGIPGSREQKPRLAPGEFPGGNPGIRKALPPAAWSLAYAFAAVGRRA